MTTKALSLTFVF